jgi:AcrR family transcriptional regulator
MRRDAERNRRKLILAASEVMRTEGGDVPMEVIAERAGLTRGTLYRNFAHRQEMYEAVLEHDLEHLAEQIASDSEADPLAFIRRTTEMMMVYERFLVALSAMQDYDFQTNQKRMVATIAPALQSAQRLGLLRATLTGDDILMACRMLSTHLRLDDPRDRNDAISLRLDLMLQGLGGPGRR